VQRAAKLFWSGQKTPRESRKIEFRFRKEKKMFDEVVKLLSTARTRVLQKKKVTFFIEKERDWTRQLRHYGSGAQRQQGCEASEIMFRVLVHVSTCLLANFLSLCTALEAVA
jgi:hypothetical protein